MFDKKTTTFSQKLKQTFITGILVLLPLIVTFYLINFLYGLLTTDFLPILAKIADKSHLDVEPYVLKFTALIIVVILIFFIGLVARAYIGNQFFKLIDKIMLNIPIAKTIYKGTKQVIDSFSATSGSSFSKVVLVEYARRDMWMLAFVVKDADTFISDITTKTESYNLFIPTAPNPTSGFVAIVSKSDVRDLDITVEDGVKFILSIGLVSLSPASAKAAITKALETKKGENAEKKSAH